MEFLLLNIVAILIVKELKVKPAIPLEYKEELDLFIQNYLSIKDPNIRREIFKLTEELAKSSCYQALNCENF